MSLIKQLREDKENNINFVDVLSLFNPTEKTKYVELLLNICKKSHGLKKHCENIKDELTNYYGIKRESLDKFNDLQIQHIWRFVEGNFNRTDLNEFSKFVDYNERGLVADNDITKITNFEQIIKSNSLAEIKTYEKDLSKQAKEIYSDDEWLVVRPLTYYSSKKYGSSTKWCTTMDDPNYFERYSKGILIYSINKKTGLKVATHKSIGDDTPQLTFWNQVDNQVDSLECGLPIEILTVIKNELSSNPVSNRSLLSEEDLQKEMLVYNSSMKKSMEEPVDMVVRGVVEEMVMMEAETEPTEEMGSFNVEIERH